MCVSEFYWSHQFNTELGITMSMRLELSSPRLRFLNCGPSRSLSPSSANRCNETYCLYCFQDPCHHLKSRLDLSHNDQKATEYLLFDTLQDTYESISERTLSVEFRRQLKRFRISYRSTQILSRKRRTNIVIFIDGVIGLILLIGCGG